MKWQLEHMPGPTDEARALQLQQWNAYDEMYEALGEIRAENPGMNFLDAYKEPAYIEKKEAYQRTVDALHELLGPLAHCARVDTDLWSTFSDIHKSEFGCRPGHGHYTVGYVKEFLATPLNKANVEED